MPRDKSYSQRMTQPNLRPREQAILVALRRGPRTIGSLADALADHLASNTDNTLRVLFTIGLVIPLNADRSMYSLTLDGLVWLQRHGLDATQVAKDAIVEATEARMMVKL